MNFYADAVRTLRTLVRAINGYEDRNIWRRRRGKPPKYHGQIAFNSKRHLSTRLKVRPCNKLIKPVITA